MAHDTPSFYQGMIGFALWHLSRGEDFAEVEGKVFAKPEFIGISDTDKHRAMDEALRDWNATKKMARARKPKSIAAAFGDDPDSTKLYGVRFIFPEGRTPSGGRPGSIPLNVPGWMTIEDVKEAIKESIRQHLLDTRGRDTLPGGNAEPEAIYITETPFDSPLNTLG